MQHYARDRYFKEETWNEWDVINNNKKSKNIIFALRKKLKNKNKKIVQTAKIAKEINIRKINIEKYCSIFFIDIIAFEKILIIVKNEGLKIIVDTHQ